MRFDQPVAGQQVVDVAIEKTEAPDCFEQQVKKQPYILGPEQAGGRRRERSLDLFFVIAEQRIDDLVLVVKVIIEIARADVHFVGDDRRRDVRLAEVVEKFQRGFENALAGAALGLALHSVTLRGP